MTRIRSTRWIGWAPGRSPGGVAMVAGAPLPVAACGGRESADPGTARDHVSTSLPRIVDSATRSTSFLAEEGTVMDDLSQGMSSLNASYPALPFQFPFAESAYASTKRAIRSHLPGGEDSPGEAIARFLNERTFIDANYEGDGVYLLRGEVLCDGEDGLPDLQWGADV